MRLIALLTLALVPSSAEEQTLYAQAAIAAPMLDMGALSRFYDAASVYRGTVQAPAAAARQYQRAHDAARALGLPRTPRTMRDLLVVPVPRPSAAYRRAFKLLEGRPDVTDRYDELILKHARKHGLSSRLVKAIIAAESEFMIGAVSPKGARGLMQVMPKTGAHYGIDPARLKTAEGSIAAGTAYLAFLFAAAYKRFKLKGVSFRDPPLWLLQRIIAAYNAGPRFLFTKGWYRETRHYVRKVMLYYQSGVTDLRRPPDEAYATPEVSMAPNQTGMLF